MPTSALLSGFTETAVRAVTPQLCLRRPTFSVAPEKVGKKMRRRRVILRADARDFLAAPRPERPLRAQDCDRSDSFRFRQRYYTHLRADCINFGSAHFRNTRPISLMHCTLQGPMWASAPTKIHSRTQIFCTTGEFVDGLPFPRQGVLLSSCVATAIDGSVVSTQAAL